MIDLCTLGTGGAIPMPDRALSSLYVRLNGRGLLIDCGEGTQTQIRRLGWGFLNIEGLLLTHYHGDHCTGLAGFLLSLDKAGRKEPFPIWGPPGLRRIIEGLMVVAPTLSFPLDLREIAGGARFTVCGFDAEAIALDHGVPCLGYHLTLARPPLFDPEKARALGIPMRLWGVLQRGEPATDGDTTYLPQQVLGAPRPGLRFLYATDTRPVPALAQLGQGADLMLLEGMYGEEEKAPLAHKNRHMLFREAAALAREAGAKRLLLTHFSNSIEDPAAYLPEARAVFPATDVAQDLLVTRLDFPQRYA